MIAAIILAAGLSRRMGRAKLLLPLEGGFVIRITVEGILASGVAPVVVVTGTEHPELAEVLAGLPVALVNNPSPEAGQASSIRIGMMAVPREAEAVLIALGDQPFVPSSVIAGLLDALRTTGKTIVAPRYRDGRGNPVLFSRETFPELLERLRRPGSAFGGRAGTESGVSGGLRFPHAPGSGHAGGLCQAPVAGSPGVN